MTTMTDTPNSVDTDHNLLHTEFLAMTTITDLSNEIINIILQQASISFKDMANFGSTCKRFLSVVNDNVLWQRKLYQRWPYLKKIYDKQIQDENYIDFMEQVKISIECRNKLAHYLSLLSERHKDLSDIDMKDFDVLFRPSMGAHPMNYYFFEDELIYLITMFPLLPTCNLTHRYYSRKLLPYLKQCHLKEVWQKFINSPNEQQTLERAATIVAQWYQPVKHVSYLNVEASLDKIAQQVLGSLKKAHPMHPILSTSAKQFSFWKHNNINDNEWSKGDGQQIIDTLRTVLFDELEFHSSCSTGFKIPTSENILIDCVLENKCGSAISLAIIFQSIARRLGVRCDVICFPTHLFLSWKPRHNTGISTDEECFYIDVLHGGNIRSKNDCPRTRGRRCPIESFNTHDELSPVEMVSRMINYLQTVSPNRQHHQDRTQQIRSLLEFRYMTNPHDVDTIELLSRHYVQNNISLAGLITALKRILDSYSNRSSIEARQTKSVLNRLKAQERVMANVPESVNIRPKIRTYKLKYAVGMVVTCYDRHHYTCVIIGWHDRYNMSLHVPENRILHSFHVDENSDLTQPFYILLCENGNTYYAAQDVLEETCPKWIQHNEIGRYFCKFSLGSHYVPNEMLKRHYPYDVDILNTVGSKISQHRLAPEYPHL